MKSLQKIIPSTVETIFLRSQIKSTQRMNVSTRRYLKTMNDENDTQKSSNDEVQILMKKITELSGIISMQQKQIIHLQEVNKYLQLGNLSKLDIIKSQRNLKQIVTTPNTIPQSPPHSMDQFSEKFIAPVESPKADGLLSLRKRTSKNFKTQIMPLHLNLDPYFLHSHHSILKMDREKTGDFNFIQNEETFKINQILDLNLKDSEAYHQYENDGTIVLLEQILKNEEHFIDMMQNAKQQKLSFIFDKFERIFMEHKQLFKLLLRIKNLIKVSQLYVTFEGAVQMTNSLLLDDALNTIKDQMVEQMVCEKATCYIYDQEKKELWSRVAKGAQEVIRIPAGQGIPGQVAEDKQLVNIKYAYLDPRFKQDPQNKVDYRSKSLLVCPIVEGDRCLGVLQCLNKSSTINKGNFSVEDEQLIKIFAEFAGVVLGNAINHNQQNLQYNKLRHIIRSAIIMGQQVDERDDLIKTAQLRIQTLMNVEKAKICYLGHGNMMNYFDDKGIRQQIQSDQGLMGLSVTKNQMVSTSNCYSDPRYNSKIDIYTNLPIIVIPISNPYNKTEVLGAIQVMFLKNISSMIFNEEIRLGRMDQEILNLFQSLLGEFLHISNLVPQNKRRKSIEKRLRKQTPLGEGGSKSFAHIIIESD